MLIIKKSLGSKGLVDPVRQKVLDFWYNRCYHIHMNNKKTVIKTILESGSTGLSPGLVFKLRIVKGILIGLVLDLESFLDRLRL